MASVDPLLCSSEHPCLPPLVTMAQLLARYEVLLFDAYGVLVDSVAALPGAVDLIAQLRALQKKFFIVTNGSSSSGAATAQRYRDLGLAIPTDAVISSGMLVPSWIKAQGLQGCRVYLLGPASSRFMLEGTGCELVPSDSPDFDLLIIGNQDGFAFLEAFNHVLSRVLTLTETGNAPRLLLPNPDLVYPAGRGRYGITSGMLALMLTEALKLRFASAAPQFTTLGKPYAPIFTEAKRRAGSESVVMIGDQIQTDIKGALAAGLDCVLVNTGLANSEDSATFREYKPTFRMFGLL